MKNGFNVLSLVFRIIFSFREAILLPRLFINKRLLWKKIHIGVFPHRLVSYSLDNERKLTKHYFKDWVLKPNLDKLESDVQQIMKVKEIRYNAIKSRTIDNDAYKQLTSSIKKSSKYAWESIIQILEEMTFFFPEIKNLMKSMQQDKNGKIRETALLIMECGQFNLTERIDCYKALHLDKSKAVRNRVLDMIYREGTSSMGELKNLLQNWQRLEEDQSIKDHIYWILSENN